MKKGEIYEGTVQTVLFPNKGIVQTEDGQAVVKNTIPGQKIRYCVTKKKKGRAQGRLMELLEKSTLETADPGCSLYPQCGGCLYRTLPYTEQLKLKEAQVRSLLDGMLQDIGYTRAYDWMGIRPSPSENAYRNKMEYTFGDEEKDGVLTLGLHRRESMYDILPAADCHIVHGDFNRIVRCVQELARRNGSPYYHKRAHTGYFRHLLIRRAWKTGEILVDLVTSSQYSGSESEEQFLSGLSSALQQLPLEGQLKGILHTVNDSVADTIHNDRTDLLFGTEYFFEELLGLRFKITPFSFFQTNSAGAEVLYETARKFLGDVRNKTVYDLYSGTGTIAQMLAPVAKTAVGVEIVEEAVEAARENAAGNGLGNCLFLAGDVLKVLDSLQERPDVIILDPPRDGVHPKALPKITAYGAELILYISCKPTSLIRDLPWFLKNEYTLEKVCCVDMFPAAQHVETVCLLSKLSEVKNHISVKIDMDEMDVTAAESKATYQEIQEWVQEKYGFHVSHLNIAKTKRKCGIIERQSFNLPKSEDNRSPERPKEKEEAIIDAFLHFKMM